MKIDINFLLLLSTDLIIKNIDKTLELNEQNFTNNNIPINNYNSN